MTSVWPLARSLLLAPARTGGQARRRTDTWQTLAISRE